MKYFVILLVFASVIGPAFALGEDDGYTEEILILLEDKIKKVYYTGENIISVIADHEAASVIFETGENAKLDFKVPKIYKVGPDPFILRNSEEVDVVIDSDECFFYAAIEMQEPEKTEIIFAFWPEHPGTIENCETFVVAPLKQIKLGIEPSKIVCADNLHLLLKPKEFKSPACVTESTYHELANRGWSVVLEWGG